MNWRPVISFFAPGIPKGQPRPRAFARVIGGRPVARVFDCGSAEGWKGAIALAAQAGRPAVPIEGPVRVDVDFLFPRPKSLMRRCDPDGPIPHATKPDRDNCEKALLDCLSTLGFWRDDCQVCAGEVRKLYAGKGCSTGAVVTISVPGTEPTAIATGTSEATRMELFGVATNDQGGRPAGES